MLRYALCSFFFLQTLISADRPVFEVASVKLFKPVAGGEARPAIDTSPTGLTVHRQSLKSVIEWAYGKGIPIEVSGPGWLETEEYEISAKAGSQVTVEQLRLMTQGLLAERFKLALHRETRTQAVYVLIPGKGGAKLREVQQPSQRGMKMGQEDGLATFGLVADSKRLTEFVSMFVERPVIDETALKGVYEISVRLEMEPNWQRTMVTGQVFRGFGHTPSVFPAMEQLGLKLEGQKRPAEILVVDHVERPTEN